MIRGLHAMLYSSHADELRAEDHGYGLITHFKLPGGFEVQLYQPRYAK